MIAPAPQEWRDILTNYGFAVLILTELFVCACRNPHKSPAAPRKKHYLTVI
jgi:hypothetical protein